MSTTIWFWVGARATVFAGIHPYVPLGRIGMLTWYQALPSEPSRVPTANISCGRKSDRNWYIVLITRAVAFGDRRTGTELTSSSPAAGKTDSTWELEVTRRFFGVVVVVEVVVVAVVDVDVVPVESATARVGSATAAANPADATRAAAIRARRLTGSLRKPT